MTVAITYRSTPAVAPATTVKDFPLTNQEIDGNFKSIEDELTTINTDALAYAIALG